MPDLQLLRLSDSAPSTVAAIAAEKKATLFLFCFRDSARGHVDHYATAFRALFGEKNGDVQMHTVRALVYIPCCMHYG